MATLFILLLNILIIPIATLKISSYLIENFITKQNIFAGIKERLVTCFLRIITLFEDEFKPGKSIIKLPS